MSGGVLGRWNNGVLEYWSGEVMVNDSTESLTRREFWNINFMC